MEPSQSEMNILSNGKSHDLGDDVGVPLKTMLDEDQYEEPDDGLENEEFLPNEGGKKPIRFTDFEGKTSFGMSVFNLGNAIMGSGILGLAYAMANTGILLFWFLLTAVAALSSYSIHLLLKSSGIVGIRAYEQLGYRAFGNLGKIAAGTAITLQNIGAMSSYLYIVKSELPLVIQAFLKVEPNSDLWYLNGNYLVIMVSASIILPLALMKQLGYLGYTSGFSLSCMVFFLTAVIFKKFQIPCPFEEFSVNGTASHLSLNDSVHIHEYNNGVVHEDDDSHCTPRMFTINPQTAYTIPILAFAFVCHPEVLPIYTELPPSLMSSCAAKLVYVDISVGNVETELLHTYSRIDPYDTLILCVRVAVLTAVTLTVPIVLFPVRRAIQQMIFPTKSFSWLRHIAIALILLTFINMLVIFAPNILGIFGIIGATSAPCLIFIFPAVFYIRIVPKEDEPMNSLPKIMAACFAALGFSFMVMSLSFIIIDWTTGEGLAVGGH
uniref:Amino acid transporter transmembrane domain-containing protein n=1 Tax=Astatotilapia calliptera TaxID=8154 RepID=A0AAX7VG98_ASTCA